MVSKEEQRIVDAIKRKFPSMNIVQSYRPDKLKNLKTGKNLEVDIFLPDFFVGFEYQGKPHFYEIYEMRNDPDKSRHHDTLKKDLSESGSELTIVELFECDLHGDIIPNIINRIKNTIPLYSTKSKFRKYALLNVLMAYLDQDYDFKKIRISCVKKIITGKAEGKDQRFIIKTNYKSRYELSDDNISLFKMQTKRRFVLFRIGSSYRYMISNLKKSRKYSEKKNLPIVFISRELQINEVRNIRESMQCIDNKGFISLSPDELSRIRNLDFSFIIKESAA